MPSQKLKRISLGIVGILILVVLFWFVRNVYLYLSFFENPGVPLLAFLASIDSWRFIIGAIGIALVLILGLYFIAKILIEIFK